MQKVLICGRNFLHLGYVCSASMFAKCKKSVISHSAKSRNSLNVRVCKRLGRGRRAAAIAANQRDSDFLHYAKNFLHTYLWTAKPRLLPNRLFSRSPSLLGNSPRTVIPKLHFPLFQRAYRSTMVSRSSTPATIPLTLRGVIENPRGTNKHSKIVKQNKKRNNKVKQGRPSSISPWQRQKLVELYLYTNRSIDEIRSLLVRYGLKSIK